MEYIVEDVPPQLFDLAEDPRECNDLAADQPALVAEMAAELRGIVADPEALNRTIMAEQRRQLDEAGGLAAIGQGLWKQPGGASNRLPGYTRPPDDIMEIVGWPNDPDWA